MDRCYICNQDSDELKSHWDFIQLLCPQCYSEMNDTIYYREMEDDYIDDARN